MIANPLSGMGFGGSQMPGLSMPSNATSTAAASNAAESASEKWFYMPVNFGGTQSNSNDASDGSSSNWMTYLFVALLIGGIIWLATK